MTPAALARAELAHDILRHARGNPLDALFVPRTVAVIGATESPGSVGRAVLENLGQYPGQVFPVNPNHATILGQATFPTIAALPKKADLAVIVTPAATVPGIVRECAAAGVDGALIISAGFKECGPSGVALERQILTEARRSRMRIIGPNCLGVMSPHFQFNATFATGLSRPGQVAFISQSGALCTAILDWSFRENVGFSAFVSIGSMLDVGWGDLIYYFGDDPHTKSIVCYMESVGDARSFLSAAREVALTKPIIVIKVGRTEAAAQAAASHTGSLTGSDEVLEAAFRRVGVLRVNTVGELFNMTEVLAKQPRPRGPRLAIVTNAGGPGALATDMLISSGGQLAPLSAGTLAKLDQFLPPHWSHGNPIDILGDADAARYGKAVKLAVEENQSDGVLVILTPQAMTDATATAEVLKPLTKPGGKPVLASWMGGPEVDAGRKILNEAGIPTFDYPDTAARTFDYMWRYSENLRALYETPTLGGPHDVTTGARSPTHTPANKRTGSEGSGVGGGKDWTFDFLQTVRRSGRTILTEFESKQVLAAYGLPTVATHLARSETEAVRLAERVGFPVVLKLHSETITHKTEVDGVQLNLRNATAVRRAWHAIEQGARESGDHVGKASGRTAPATRPSCSARFLGVTVQPMVSLAGYELILGSSIDPQFGPVLLFGAGGQLVEVFKDRALGLPPLNATLARRLMERTRICTALRGVRGRPPVDLAALEQLLVRFSQLVVEQRWISEIDINPLLASPERLLALDARIILHGLDVREENLPRPAIRPYPVQYVTSWKLKDGTGVVIRPIRPEDEPWMVKFHQTLSSRSVYYRYFMPLKLEQRIAHERLARLCFIDYDREMALVVEHRDPGTVECGIIAVARLSKLHGGNEAEFAMVVSDLCQKQGLGTQLLRMLVQVGRDEKLDRITATILPDNHEMLNLVRRVGFTVVHQPQSNECLACLSL